MSRVINCPHTENTAAYFLQVGSGGPTIAMCGPCHAEVRAVMLAQQPQTDETRKSWRAARWEDLDAAIADHKARQSAKTAAWQKAEG